MRKKWGHANSFILSVDCKDLRGINFKSYINCLEEIHGKFVLHKAAKDGDLDLVKYLHQNGANLTAKNNQGKFFTYVAKTCPNSKFLTIELVSKELNHLAAILHVYAGGLNFMK